MDKKNVVLDKSIDFALHIIKIYKFLIDDKKEYVLSKQLLRSGTAIGALIKESEHAQSKADFLNKVNIALKEANETEYWLDLLNRSEYIDNIKYNQVKPKIDELLKLLTSIVKTTKINLNRL